MRIPPRETILALLASAEAIVANRGTAQLETDLHRAFQMRGDRPKATATRIDRTFEFMKMVLPGWGYSIRGPLNAETPDSCVAAVYSLSSEISQSSMPADWGAYRHAEGQTLALALLKATLKALARE